MTFFTPSTHRHPLRIGVVGCGWAGQRAVEAANAVPRTTCVAIADVDDERRTATATASLVPRAYGDYRDLLADPDVDAVYLATNPEVRTPMAIDSFRAGKHTLVQKPHALRATHVHRIEREALKADRVLQFCFFMRHFPVNRKLQARLLNGAIGEIYHGRIFVQFNEDLTHSDADYWLYAYGRMGGALAQHASHELDLAWWYMGCPRPQWAFATRHSPYCRYRGPEGPSEDYFSGLIGFEGERTIQIEATRLAHLKVGRQFQLFGKDGAVDGTTISRLNAKREYQSTPVAPPAERRKGASATFFYEIEHFAAAVAGERQPDVNADDSFTYMRMLEALYQSAAKNSVFPYVPEAGRASVRRPSHCVEKGSWYADQEWTDNSIYWRQHHRLRPTRGGRPPRQWLRQALRQQAHRSSFEKGNSGHQQGHRW